MKKLDQYGLPACFKVRLTEDWMGNVILTPVCKKWEDRVGKSNLYNGAGTVFIQEAHVEDWRSTLPRKAFYRDVCGEVSFNDNAVFIMDSWEFRHLVGGQCD